MANRASMLIAFSSLCLAGCAASERAALPVPATSVGYEITPEPIPAMLPAAARKEIPTYTQSGVASWYREKGRFKRTANGEKPEPSRLTAAHRSLPFGTIVRVTSLRSGRSILVRINDRGPYAHHRIIDVSYAAAANLGILHDGITKVDLSVYASDQCGVSPTSFLCSEAATAARSTPNPTRAAKSHRTISSLSARSDDRTSEGATARY
jgi:rare lipoprotein A